jgi:hypothetical protein
MGKLSGQLCIHTSQRPEGKDADEKYYRSTRS